MSAGRRHKPSEVKREKGKGRRYLFFLIPLVLVIAVLGYVVTQPAGISGSVSVGSAAPDFQLQAVGPNGLTGETVKLSSFRGKVILLEFMVSWCQYCRWVAPALESIHEEYQSKNVAFISVGGTYSGADANSTAAFIRQYRTQWTYALDSNNNIFSRYQVKSTPTFFIIDGNGVILNTFTGVVTSQTLTSALDAALAR